MSTQRMKRLRHRAYLRQAGLCYWCARPMILKTPENAAEVWNHPRVCTGDHLVLKSNGGPLSRFNIVAACRECNNGRHQNAPMLSEGPTLGDLWPVRVDTGWPWLSDLINYSRRNSSNGARSFFSLTRKST